MIRILMALAMLAAMGGCDDNRPATTDQSTPKAAARSLLHALDQRDAAALDRLYIAQTPDQQRFVKAMGTLLASTKALYDAGAARYGSQDAKQLLGSAGPGADMSRQFTQAQEVVEGDAATLTSDSGEQLKLKKVGEQWRIIPGNFGSDAAKMDLAHSAIYLETVAAQLSKIAGEVSAGKLSEVDDARARIAAEALPAAERAALPG